MTTTPTQAPSLDQLADEILRKMRPAPMEVEIAQPATPAEANPWRQAVDRELVNAGLDCLAPDAEATPSLARLLSWRCTIALDPAVSEEAQALIERGRASAPSAQAVEKRRLDWLHSPASHNVDGYEWGIFRVKWVNGQAAEVWQTNADFSDLDAAMGDPVASLPTPPIASAPAAERDE